MFQKLQHLKGYSEIIAVVKNSDIWQKSSKDTNLGTTFLFLIKTDIFWIIDQKVSKIDIFGFFGDKIKILIFIKNKQNVLWLITFQKIYTMMYFALMFQKFGFGEIMWPSFISSMFRHHWSLLKKTRSFLDSPRVKPETKESLFFLSALQLLQTFRPKWCCV